MIFLVGNRVFMTVSVRDASLGTIVDPSAFTFYLRPAAGSGLPVNTYAWNGTIWVNSEMVVGQPSRVGTGVFDLKITIPYDNSAKGRWAIGWKSVQNLSGLGEGSGEQTFQVTAAEVLG